MTSADDRTPASDADHKEAKATFPMVGVGASAGGLEAFAQLLATLDVTTGMAFVLIQHLDPKQHESILGEILSRSTTMPVVVVNDAVSVEPNHVYVIPLSTRMTNSENKLKLAPRDKSEDGLYPIDHFFCSLAREWKDNAIGVIWSGTGSDGAKGIAAIIAAGGVAFAQEATNQELTTVNDELQDRFEELTRVNSDLTNLFEAVTIPIVMVSDKLRLRRFTEASEKVLNISEKDVGKSLEEIGPKLRIAGLTTLTSEVIRTLNTKEEEIQDVGGRWYSLRIRPYRTRDNRIDGAVIALRDVTKEKQVEERTTDAKNIAEAANQAKSDFLANMSHEIRTPLSAILGYSELLANPNQNKSDALRCTTRIQKNVEQLTELIDEILDISKIEAGKFEVERVKFTLLPELADIFTLLQDRASAKGLAFDLEFEGEIPEFISSCPRRLRQIMLNLVSNALKFTVNGSVSVVVKLVANSQVKSNFLLTFTIKDTGCGLSSEQQKRLFRAFTQADSSVTRKYGGTGLGLVLARRLAETLGGGVQLSESKVGEGSTFTFCLDPGPLVGVTMLTGITTADLESRRCAPQSLFVASQRLEDLRILLVEDGADNQILMRHVLEASGATVVSAENGADALKVALENDFDLILMDMQMPILDGYETTKQMRAKGYSTPIVALTANAMRGQREACLAIGCVEYIAKPVKGNALVDVVAKFAKKKDLVPPEVRTRSEFYDDSVVGPLVGQFVKNLSLRVAALHDAELRSDWNEISSLAHQLAGSCGGYGFPEMGKKAAKIEAQAKDNVSHDVMAKSIARFGSLCDAAIRGN